MTGAVSFKDPTVCVSFLRDVRGGSIVLEGELDAFSAFDLRSRVLGLVKMPLGHTLQLRLERLSFCDLAGLDAVMSLTQLGYATEITLGDSPVRRLFELMGLSAQFEPTAGLLELAMIV